MADDKSDKSERGFNPKLKYIQPENSGISFMLTREGAFKYQDGSRSTVADAVDFFWTIVGQDPRRWNNELLGYDWLLQHAGDASGEDLRRTLGWLEGAIAIRDRDAAVAACRYLETMPSALLASNCGRLLSIFNSRKVGMVWQLTPELDKRPLPAGPIPVFGKEAGFGLIRAVPKLYVKMALIDSELKDVVIQIAKEAMSYEVSLPSELIKLIGSSPLKQR